MKPNSRQTALGSVYGMKGFWPLPVLSKGCWPAGLCSGCVGSEHNSVALSPHRGTAVFLSPGTKAWWWGWSTWAICPLGLLPAMLCVVSAEAEPALGAKPFPAITDGTALALFISACPSQKLNLWIKGIAVHRARRVHADLTFRTTFCSYRDATFITPLLAILFSIQLESTAPFFPVRAGNNHLRIFAGGPAHEIGSPFLPHISSPLFMTASSICPSIFRCWLLLQLPWIYSYNFLCLHQGAGGSANWFTQHGDVWFKPRTAVTLKSLWLWNNLISQCYHLYHRHQWALFISSLPFQANWEETEMKLVSPCSMPGLRLPFAKGTWAKLTWILPPVLGGSIALILTPAPALKERSHLVQRGRSEWSQHCFCLPDKTPLFSP